MIWDSLAANPNLGFDRILKLIYVTTKLHLATVFSACTRECSTQKMVPFLFYSLSEWLQLSPMAGRIPLICNPLKEAYLTARQ